MLQRIPAALLFGLVSGTLFGVLWAFTTHDSDRQTALVTALVAGLGFVVVVTGLFERLTRRLDRHFAKPS